MRKTFVAATLVTMALLTAQSASAQNMGEPVYTLGGPATYSTYTPVAAAPAPKKAANPAAKAYKPLYYDNDFSYLTDDYNGPRYLGDGLKNMQVGENGRLSIGGEYRYRYHSEQGMGSTPGFTRFQDTDNEFSLGRLRVFADYKATDRLRFYIEGIYADTLDRDDSYVPRPIDRNYGDLLNAFADIKVSDSTTVRIGRQELLYGAQRVVSPLDWANTRRTFTGVRTISKFDDWNIDAFYTQPVQVIRNEFDRGNEQQDFYGTYLTYNGLENDTVELYYLGLDDDTNGGTLNLDTFGTRIFGSRGSWLYETEAAIQTGTQQALGQSHEAYAVTAGIGRKFNDMAWKPQLWFYYDYASGNDVGDASTFGRYNQLFPLAHKYLGFIDALARANVASPNVRLTMSPTKKLSFLIWYYNFQAAESQDIIPSIGGTPAQDPNSTDFGNELDLLATYKINARRDVVAGYSHFWRGDKILGNTDADFFYLQLSTRF